MARIVIRSLRDAGADLALAPERYVAASLRGERGVALGAIVALRNERVTSPKGAIVLDTTHAKDGVLDVAAARAAPASTSAKKRVREGDLLVSRLRPYLRQIGLACAPVTRAAHERVLACSTEFYVLCAADGGDLAFLLPFLLGGAAQAALAAGQEGGHHPRVPRETVLALRVPAAFMTHRAIVSARVHRALDRLYFARAAYADALAAGARKSGPACGGE
jgi:hypothetical protein